MKNKNSTLYIILITLAVVGIGLMAYPAFQGGPSNLGPLASCLKENGVIFYGAFWCPHCQVQKKMFGTAVGDLPYVECSTPDGQRQLQICKDAGVEGYPTWVFPDGTRLTGEIPLSTLAQKSGCDLPK